MVVDSTPVLDMKEEMKSQTEEDEITSNEYQQNIPLVSPLRRSLFPNIPPTLRFYSASDGVVVKTFPIGVRRHLKWKWTLITPCLVKETVRRSGFQMTKHEQTWVGMWGKHLKCAYYCTMNSFQKVNHFPGSFHLGRKDKLHLNLSKLRKNSSNIDLDFVPQTYLLPQEGRAFQKAWKKEGNMHRWIAKPPASSRGTGVFIVSRWGQIASKLNEPLVVQKYIHKPFLINGNKFDLRLYALVTGWDPLRVYVYNKGMLRFATETYSENVDSLDNALMHLTNYSLNKHSENYSNEQKWSLEEFWEFMRTHHPNLDCNQIWNSLVNVIVKTLLSAEGPIGRLTNSYAPSRYSCFELFGFDILLDSDLKPWLLEVNISPSMRASCENDLAIKEPLVRDLLNMAAFRLPKTDAVNNLDPTEYNLEEEDILYTTSKLHRKQLSPAEAQKKQLFTDEADLEESYSILEDLLPTDVVTLAEYEDELSRLEDTSFVRAVPSTQFEHIVPPRYYNKLVNAWEARYSDNRDKGREILKDLCLRDRHLLPTNEDGKTEPTVIEKKRNLWRNKVRVSSAKKMNYHPGVGHNFNRALRIRNLVSSIRRSDSMDSLSGSSSNAAI